MMIFTSPFAGLRRLPIVIELSTQNGVRVKFGFEEKTLSTGWCVAMRVLRTQDGQIWEELSTKLRWLDELRYGLIWPPDPIDVHWIKLDNKHIEMCISADFAIPCSDMTWIASYVPAVKKWRLMRAEKSALERK
jgi:hypothetical protein